MANGLSKALFPGPDLSFPLSLGGDQRGWGEVVAVVFLSAQTPVITSSIKPRTLRGGCCHSEDLSSRSELPSNLESWKESKKARKQRSPTGKGRGKWAWQRREIIRSNQPYAQAQNAGQPLKTLGPLCPSLLLSSHPLLGAWHSTTADVSFQTT